MADEALSLLLTDDQIQARVAELGREISRDYTGREPILIGVLKGSLVFLADLVRKISIPVAVDFMSISSYGNGARSSGVVRILKDLDESITDRDVILIEDIIDTGLTLTYILATISARKPASLEVCGLLDKTARRIIEVPVRYKGFDIPDEFVIGYGLDYEGRYRNIRDVIAVRDLDALADPEAVPRVLAAARAQGSETA